MKVPNAVKKLVVKCASGCHGSGCHPPIRNRLIAEIIEKCFKPNSKKKNKNAKKR